MDWEEALVRNGAAKVTDGVEFGLLPPNDGDGDRVIGETTAESSEALQAYARKVSQVLVDPD